MRSLVVRKQSTGFALIAFLCLAPSALPAGHTTAAVASSEQVNAILDDFSGATAPIATANQESAAALSGPATSHLISLVDDGHQDRGHHVKVAEPQAAFTWLIDLAGLGGLLFYLNRRRPTPANVNA